MSGLDGYPVFLDSMRWDEAQHTLAEHGLADGHLQVPPSERRLAEMLAGIADPDASHGQVPPMFGELTARAVAYNCVLAGCRAGELPIVLTAARAALAAEFNLLGLLTTTGSPAVAVVVHGPVAARLGLNAGTNCLGPGNRANAAIGRALALVMRTIGGARETVGDMATLGQPAKTGLCFAEVAGSVLPSLPARRGLEPDADAVTVLGLSGTLELLPLDPREGPEAVLAPVAAAMLAGCAVASAGTHRTPEEQVFILPPELASWIDGQGWDLARIQRYLFEVEQVDIPQAGAFVRTAPISASPEDIHPIVSGGPGVKMAYLPLWMGGTRTQTLALHAD